VPCSHEDCPQRPRWKPVLLLRQNPRSLNRRKLTFRQLGYCDDHKQATTVEALLSDEGHDKIDKVLREAGREKIDPRATTLSWEKLTEADRRRLRRVQHHTSTPPTREDPTDEN